MSLTVHLGKKFNIYTLLTVILGAQGAIMTVTGNSRLVGAALAGLGVIVVPLHGYLSGLVISVPASVYAIALKVYAVLIGLTGAAAVINQWVLSYSPGLKGEVTLALSVAALVASIMAQAFHISASKKAAAAAGQS